MLWAGTIGLESPIGARVDGCPRRRLPRVTVGPADVIESGTSPGSLGSSLREAGLEVVLDPVMNWYGGAPMPGAGRYGEFGTDDALRMAEALGAVSISVIGPFMPDEVPAGELPERFADFCDRAAGFGARVHLEFMPMSAVADLGAAWPIVRDADRPNGGILLDTWHFFRSKLRHRPPRAGAGRAHLRGAGGGRVRRAHDADRRGDVQPHVAGRRRARPHRASFASSHRTGGLQWVGPEVISPALAGMAPVDAARLAGDRVRVLVADASPDGRDLMETGLAGRSVIVTGATANIGRGIAVAFAAEGANVVVVGRDAAAGARVCDDLTARGAKDVLWQAADVTDRGQVDAMVTAVARPVRRDRRAREQRGRQCRRQRVRRLEAGDLGTGPRARTSCPRCTARTRCCRR